MEWDRWDESERRMQKHKIYQRELDKLLDAGEDAATARSIAAERAEEIYWDKVDAALDDRLLQRD